MPESACEIPASNKDGSGGKYVLYCITELTGGENPDRACDIVYIDKWKMELSVRIDKMN